MPLSGESEVTSVLVPTSLSIFFTDDWSNVIFAGSSVEPDDDPEGAQSFNLSVGLSAYPVFLAVLSELTGVASPLEVTTTGVFCTLPLTLPARKVVMLRSASGDPRCWHPSVHLFNASPSEEHLLILEFKPDRQRDCYSTRWRS